MDQQSLPLSPDQITAGFLTSVLKNASALKLATVTGIQFEAVDNDTEFNAQVARLHLQYDVPEVDAPQTIIVKLPTTRTDLRDNAAIFQPGNSESWFYGHGAKRTPVRTPKAYFNTVNRATNESFLILEDLDPVQEIDWVQGISADSAKLALESLTRLHATWWGFDPRSEPGLAHIVDNGDDGIELVERFYTKAWPRFVAETTCEITDEARRFGAALVGRVAEAEAGLDRAPTTLIHGDYRLGNVLFKTLPEGPSCWVIDWEDIQAWSGMFDVAWFLGGCLPLNAVDQELPLLRFYHQTLEANGVQGYSWSQCQSDYRIAMTSAFVQGILTAVPAADGNDEPSALGHAIGQRYIAAATRWKLSDLLSR